jgi:hypothetical protein
MRGCVSPILRRAANQRSQRRCQDGPRYCESGVMTPLFVGFLTFPSESFPRQSSRTRETTDCPQKSTLPAINLPHSGL